MENKTISQIESLLLKAEDESSAAYMEAKKDSRKGVRNLIAKWERDKARQRALQAKHLEMTVYENKARKSGFELIAGIDEAGRGPLAGPVVAAAVILPADFFLPGLDDSKKLSAKKREEYEQIIRQESLGYSIAVIGAEEIDIINIYQASVKAMKAAVIGLKPAPDYLLVDAVKLETPYPSESIIKGDAKSISIAAASVLAKTERDRIMTMLAEEYPCYGFERNMGYGTKEHLEALEAYGITPYHRKTFAPVKNVSEVVQQSFELD